MYINTAGIVLRETAYRDSSKILTMLTGEEGKLTVSARGALRRNSKLAAATQLLVFSEITLSSSRDRWTLTEARSIEQFTGLRDDIALLALGAYFAELTEAVADEDSPNPELMPLILNALFALSEKIKAPALVKPAFELRLMAASGFAPLLDQCSVCGAKEAEYMFLDYAGGTINCGGCDTPGAFTGSHEMHGAGEETRAAGSAGSAVLSRGALHAARYIIGCDARKLFSFTLGDNALLELASATEGYLLAQLDRSFRTLDYYKRIF